MRKRHRFLRVFVFSIAIMLVWNCVQNKEAAADGVLKLRGEQLSKKYCSGCHSLVDPGLLNQLSWTDVLYKMREEMNKVSMPIDEIEWDTLQSYFNRFSPNLLSTPAPTINLPASLFSKNDSMLNVTATRGANITFLKYQSYDTSVFFGDMRKRLYKLKGSQVADTFFIENVPVDMRVETPGDIAYVLCIGTVAPSEKANGQLLELQLDSRETKVLIDSLKRPVHFEREDIDNDQEPEFIVCSFGSTVGLVNSGRLSVFKLRNGGYQELVLKESPGATKVIVNDYNHDGKPDLFALFSQGDERIIRFTNEGSLKFSAETLLEFPPVYGASDFMLRDMNGDGLDDIILVNGDNGDYSPIYKPYHGVRIFRNQGGHQFEEVYFQPINGAMRFVVNDFDFDEDDDIVVLAVYPNLFFTPEEILVYLRNDNDNFSPFYLKKIPESKWMVIDAGDIDGDGDIDIITGANTMLTFPVPYDFKKSFDELKKPISVFSNTHMP